MDRKITLEDIRKVLNENLDYSFCDKTKSVETMSDDELLKINIVEDIQLDSLDFIVLTMSLERNCNVVIPDEAIDAVRENGNTVQALLDQCNRFLIHR